MVDWRCSSHLLAAPIERNPIPIASLISESGEPKPSSIPSLTPYAPAITPYGNESALVKRKILPCTSKLLIRVYGD